MASKSAPKFEDTAPLFEETESVDFDLANMNAGLDEDGLPIETGPSQSDAFIEGAKEGATFGFSGEISGGIGAGFETLSGAPGQPGEEKLDQFLRLYDEYKRSNEEKTNAAMNAHPGTFALGNVAGGFALPIPSLYNLGKIAPALKAGTKMAPAVDESLILAPTLAKNVLKTPSMVEKMHASSKVAIPAAGLAAAGMSEHGIGEPGQLSADIVEGMGLGLGTGLAIPPIAQTAVTTGKALGGITGIAAEGAKKIIGKPLALGYKYGVKGAPAIGEEAGEQVGREMTEFAEQVPKEMINLVNKIAKERREIIQLAEDSGAQVDPTRIDDFLSQFLDQKYVTNDAAFEKEISQFKEMLRTGKEGKLVKKTKEIFLPEEGNTQLHQFIKRYNELKANPPKFGDQPSDREKILRKFERIKAESRALPTNPDPTKALPRGPVEPELVFEPSDMPGVEFGIIRQPQYDEMGNLLGYKRLATQEIRKNKAVALGEPEIITPDALSDDPNLTKAIIRQPELDEAGNIVGYRTIDESTIPMEEFAKSKMVTSVEREGGRDLTQPSELFRLYNDLKNKQFSNPDVQRIAGDASNEGKAIFRDVVPGSEELDSLIHQTKNASERLGLDTQKPDPKGDMQRLTSLIHQLRAKGTTGATARANVTQAVGGTNAKGERVVGALEMVDPELATRFRDKMSELAERHDLAYGPKIYLPRLLATPVSALRWTGYGAGKTIYALQKHDPMYIGTLANKIASIPNSKTASYVSEQLNKAANMVQERDRNAVLFGLMQNPAYRQLIQEHVDAEPEPEAEE